MGRASRRKHEAARDRQELLEHVLAAGPEALEVKAEALGPRMPFEILYNFTKEAPLTISTPVLLNLTRLAREAGMTRAFADLDDLDPDAAHVVLWAARHWSEDLKHDNVRCSVSIGTRQWRAAGPDYEPPSVILDFPTRQFALLVASRYGVPGFHKPEILLRLATNLGLDIDEEIGVRSWTGSRSMDRVAGNLTSFWHLAALSEVAGTDDGMAELMLSYGWPLDEIQEAIKSSHGPRGLQSMRNLHSLVGAHPIVCEPEWIQAMDDRIENVGQLNELAREMQLPFEIIYLDFEGPGGYQPLIPILGVDEDGNWVRTEEEGEPQASLKLSGALCWRNANSSLEIVPFGFPFDDEGNHLRQIDPLGFSAHDALGRVVFDEAQREPLAEWKFSYRGSSERLAIMAAPLGTGPRLMGPATIVLPFSKDQLDHGGETVNTKEFCHGWAAAILSAARRALGTLHLLQAGNVELVEAAVSRQVRRAGERAGLPISKQVAVRLEKKLYTRPPGMESGTVDWTHAWWVAGHPRYYPLGTRKADCQLPDKLVNHPAKGPCFMEWVAPHIKGNRAKGVVEKTRIVHDNRRAA